MKTPSNLNLLTGILESSKESVIFALDCNYCYLAFNENHRQTMKNIWGVDIKVGDNMLDFIKYQEDRSKAKTNFDRALNGESFTVIEQYGDSSINRRWYQNEYNPLYDDNGNIIGLTVFLSDVTEREKAEEEKQQKAEEYEMIFEASNSAMFLVEVVDEKTFIFVRSNRVGREITGFSNENIFGKTPEEILGEEPGREVVEKYQQCLNTKSGFSYEETLLLSKGERTFYTFLTPIFDKNSELTHIVASSVDVTEFKEMQEKFKLVTENIEEVVWLRSGDNKRMLYINPAYEKVWGRSCQSLYENPDSFIDAVIDEDKQRVIEEFEKENIAGGGVFDLEYRIKRPDGDLRWVYARSFLVKDEQGRKSNICGIAMDITKQKQAENKLEENKELLRKYFDKAPIGINIINLNGGFLDANLISSRTMGYSREELFNSNVFDFIDESYHDLVQRGFKDLEKQDYTYGEAILNKRDGENIWVEIHASKLDHEKVLCYSFDITARKRAEKALKESEEKFRAYVENAPIGIFVVDEKGKFIDANPQACRMREYTKEELLNKEIKDAVHPDYKQVALDNFQKVKDKGSSQDTILGLRKDGSEFWLDLLAVKISDGLYMSYQTDVTERVERERKIQENEEKYRTLFEQNMLAIYLHDFDGNIIDVNKQACSQLGYNYKELLDMTVFDLTYTKEYGGYLTRQEILSIWYQMELGDRTTVEDMHQRKDGSLMYSEVSTGVISYNNRNIILSMIQDITDRKKAEEELKESEERFQKMLSLIPDMISIQDPDMNIIYSNWNGFGEVPEEYRVLNTKCYRTYRGYEDICSDCQAKTVLDTKEPIQVEMEIMEGLWVDLRVIPMLDKDGNVEYFVEWVRDITNIKKSEEALKEKEKLLREYFDNSPAGINIINKKGDYLDVNFVTTQMLGRTKEELLSYNIFDFVETPYHEMIKNWFPLLEEQGYVTGEVMVSTKHGKRIWNEVHAAKLDKDRILTFSIDINERKQAEESIHYLAFHDSLTGLFNRNYFDRELTNIDHERQLPLGVIMADINGLKLINDSYGQNVGDEVLKSAAHVIRKSCREEDIIIRWGGDEFVILLPEVSIVEIENIKKRIKNNSKDVFVKDIPISLSLGSEIKETIDLTAEEVIKKAEDNMQVKKVTESRSARNSVLKAIINTLQAKSYETEAHTQRMIMMAWEIGEKLEFPEDELNRLKLVITLHDIGKINISENTLTKKGKLTDEEWEEMKKHPEIGYKIAKSTDEFSHVAEEILSHHERWDGKGYPGGLKGEEIPLMARITAIVDAYEVMSNGRPYKEPMPHEEIIAEFRRCAGTQFDPELTEVFIDVLKNQLEN